MQKNYILPWTPRYLLHQNPELKAENKLLYDKYGDSYNYPVDN